MEKLWDIKDNKYIQVENRNLCIMRKFTNEEYVNLNKLPLSNKNKIKEVLDSISLLWNNCRDNTYNSKKIKFDKDFTVKISIFLNEEESNNYMKIRLINKKDIDFIKLDIANSRKLYAIMRDNIRG